MHGTFEVNALIKSHDGEIMNSHNALSDKQLDVMWFR